MNRRSEQEFWKRFSADAGCLHEWLQGQEIRETNGCILIIIVLLLRGETDAYRILSATLKCKSIREAVFFERRTEYVNVFIPDNLVELILRWSISLPRKDSTLGWVYEKLAAGRRSKGLYYTPSYIIDFILKHTVETLNVIDNPFCKVLDPACGCGFFLLRAYEVLWGKYHEFRELLTERYSSMDWSDAGIHCHILQYNLWGADIDPLAAEAAATGLLLKYPEMGKQAVANIIACDSLIKPGEWAADFNCIIGNPPYISYGLRGSGKLPDGYRNYLRDEYKESAEYKLSYYALFIQRGIELLQEGGRLGFIVPDSFLLGRYFSKIRNYILQQTDIQLIAHIDAKVFSNAVTGYSVIAILTRNSQAGQNQQGVDIYQINDTRTLPIAEPACQYSQQYFATLPHKRFRVFFDKQIKDLVDHLDKTGQPLKLYASGHSGIRSKSCQADVVSDRQPECLGNWRKGLVSGNQIIRYDLRYDGHWILIDPDKLYKGGWDKTIIEQRKILVRQTGDSIIACIDTAGYYHLNNLHSFILKNDTVTLDYLLLLLNSRLMDFYYHVTSMEYGRSMAQTDIESIELLPICVQEEVKVQAPQLAAMMCKSLANKQSYDAFKEYVNQLVYRIYELDEQQVSIIEEYERQLLQRSRRRKAY